MPEVDAGMVLAEHCENQFGAIGNCGLKVLPASIHFREYGRHLTGDLISDLTQFGWIGAIGSHIFTQYPAMQVIHLAGKDLADQVGVGIGFAAAGDQQHDPLVLEQGMVDAAGPFDQAIMPVEDGFHLGREIPHIHRGCIHHQIGSHDFLQQPEKVVFLNTTGSIGHLLALVTAQAALDAVRDHIHPFDCVLTGSHLLESG